MPPLGEFVEEIAPLWESRWLTNMGEKHREFERELKSRLKVANASLFCNGHLALECALEALGVTGEVITTPFTFASTVHAIKRVGATPVFADVRPGGWTLDPESVERMVTPRTTAIVPVHVYGNLCDWRAIREVAERHGLKVVYDAAHAFGVEFLEAGEWRGAASLGDASMLSFHATKVFNTIEGGCVCFGDPALYDKLGQWKNFGITGPEDVEYPGGNAKMNEFCAAMGLCNLRHLDGEVAKRKDVFERYLDSLSGVPGLSLCVPPEGVRHNYAYMPVVFGDAFGATRDEVFSALAARGVFARKYFHPLASDYGCYRGVYASERTPVAAYAAARVLTLPMYADLALEDVDRICAVVRGCAR